MAVKSTKLTLYKNHIVELIEKLPITDLVNYTLLGPFVAEIKIKVRIKNTKQNINNNHPWFFLLLLQSKFKFYITEITELSKNVLWTSESSFELLGSDRSKFIRHCSNKRRLVECVSRIVKHEGGNIMMWRHFCHERAGKFLK